jgi:hypothetical protein
MVQQYLAFLTIEHNETEAALADDEHEDKEDSDTRSLSGDHDNDDASLPKTHADEPVVMTAPVIEVTAPSPAAEAPAATEGVSYAAVATKASKPKRGKHAHAVTDLD